jgi:hypothetical protein
MIKLPKDWKTYHDSVRDRCRNLIDLKIWNGIDIHQFEMWRQNFTSDEEKYFSACVLDSLVYRSNEQTYSLINELIYKNINNLYRTLDLNNLTYFPTNMQNPLVDPLIRFVPVIREEDPVTKSSYAILRFMKRHFHISEKWIINPWKIEEHLSNGVKVIVFIDDFMGTGHQFDEACIWQNLSPIIKNNTVIYAPLVAHQKGIDYVLGQYPNINITYVEKLQIETHSFFSNYFEKETVEAKEFYLHLLKKFGISPSTGNEYGYGNMELTFAFEHAAPDNSLEILYARNNGCNPLFNR